MTINGLEYFTALFEGVEEIKQRQERIEKKVDRLTLEKPAKKTMKTKEAAEYTSLSVATLESYRTVRGGGPDYIKGPGARGSVSYSIEALDKWMAERTQRGGER